MAFQRALVRAAGNVGFELVLNSFARFPDEHPQLVALLYDRRDESVGFYDATLSLLATRDAELARNMVRGALEAMDAEWLLRHARSDAKVSVASETSPKAKPTTEGAPKRGPGKGRKKP